MAISGPIPPTACDSVVAVDACQRANEIATATPIVPMPSVVAAMRGNLLRSARVKPAAPSVTRIDGSNEGAVRRRVVPLTVTGCPSTSSSSLQTKLIAWPRWSSELPDAIGWMRWSCHEATRVSVRLFHDGSAVASNSSGARWAGVDVRFKKLDVENTFSDTPLSSMRRYGSPSYPSTITVCNVEVTSTCWPRSVILTVRSATAGATPRISARKFAPGEPTVL